MRAEGGGHERVPLIELRWRRVPAAQRLSGPAAEQQPGGLRPPRQHAEPLQSCRAGKPQDDGEEEGEEEGGGRRGLQE